MSNLPISSRQVIQFRPAEEAVRNAKEALAEAERRRVEAQTQFDAASGRKVSAAAASAVERNLADAVLRFRAAEDAVAAAEARLETDNPVYALRVPTIPSRSAANRDLAAMAIKLNSNAELVQSLRDAALVGMLTPEDEEFVCEVEASLRAAEAIPEGSWPRLHALASSVPGGPAGLIADRVYHAEMFSWCMVRHHLRIAGRPSPLPDEDMSAISPQDFFLISRKLSELMTPAKGEVKN